MDFINLKLASQLKIKLKGSKILQEESEKNKQTNNYMMSS